MSPLRDVRVLELGSGVAGAFCARLLGGLGADVVKIEPPGGDPTRGLGHPLPDGPPGALFRFLNSGKRSVVLDLCSVVERAQVAELARRADVVVDALPPGTLAACGLDPVAVLREHATLVVASLTPFGQTGPRRDWRATELTLQADGGLLYLTGHPGEPPRRLAGPQAQLASGLHGAVAVLAALVGRTGGWIDVSTTAVVAGLLEGTLTEYAYNGVERQRQGNRRPRDHPLTVLPCRDGYAGVFVASPSDWEVFARFAGHPEWADDARFRSPSGRRQNADELDALLAGWLAAWDRAALFHAAQAWRLPFAMALRPGEVRADPHLAARGFWEQDGLPGPPFRLEGVPWRSGPAPRCGVDTAGVLAEWLADPPRRSPATAPARLPLAGLRVVDLTALWAGPYATRLLADLGAEVVKVEGPWRPDGTRGPARVRGRQPIYPGGRPGPRPYNRAALFNELNRNKRALAVDLRHPGGLALLRDLVAGADVLVESFSPRVLPNWGLDDATLAGLNPRLIALHMPAFGRDGPYRDYVALGGGLELMSGLAWAGGLPGPPLLAGVAWPDPMAGAAAALAALAALRWRERTGRGLQVEVAQWEVALQLAGAWLLRGAADSATPDDLDPPASPQGVYPCRGRDAWLALSIESDAAWSGLCRALGALDLAADPRFATTASRLEHGAPLDAALRARTRRHDRFRLAARSQRAGVAAAVVRRSGDLAADAQLAARQFFLRIEYGETGVHDYPGVPLRSDAWLPPPTRPAPRFAEHNLEVLGQWLGLGREAIRDLHAQGVLAEAPEV